MWDVIAGSISSVVSAALTGAGIGIVVVCVYASLMPYYVQLWNRKYTLRLSHFIVLALICFLTIVGFSVWGITAGLEQSGLQIGEAALGSLENDTNWIMEADNRIGASAVMASKTEQVGVYLESALESLSALSPALVGFF